MAPTRYIFADLDALNQDVCAYMRAHPKEFSDAELTKHFPISARNLTKLLSHPSGVAKHFQGSYYYLKLKDVEAFRAAGWEMRPKSASKHRTLGFLPKPNRNPEDDVEVNSKTLVLVAGKLAGSVLHGVDKYFEAGWRVQCYCFRDRDAKVYDRLALEHPTHFKCVYLDTSVKILIKEVSGVNDMVFTVRDPPRASPRRFAAGNEVKSASSNNKLSSLYEYIHELQVKVLAMEADSAAQRTKQHDDLHYQLQQQQEAFACQLIKQDENLQTRLREQQKDHERHEQLVKERVEVCATEVATALSNLGELSERVKQDVREYQRARLDEELARWRREPTDRCVMYTASLTGYAKPMNSTLLEAIDAVLKQNGVETGIQNWRVALVVLVVHKVTSWLSSASFGMDYVGILVTSIAIVVIASCFADAN